MMLMKWIINDRTLLSLLLSFFVTINVFASNNDIENTGSIYGKVTASDGSPVQGATVLLKEKNKTILTDENGEFEFKKIPHGNYVIQISMIGNQTIEKTVVLSSAKTSVSFQLKISVNELKEVTVSNAKYKTGNVSSTLRLTTPIIELPQNIQIVTKGVLNDQQIFDMLEGIQRNVSGVQKLEHWDNYAYLNMRGTQLTAFRNGMNVKMPWGPLTEDMSMVERIEFVKGPAGFMLAAGDPSGFYNVVTKKPSGLNKGEVSLTLGSFDNYRATADVDTKLSKDGKLLFRLNVMGELKNSFRDYEYNNRYSIVPVLKYLIDSNTSVTLEYTHQFSQMSVIGSNYAFSKRKYADLPVSFTTAEPNLDPTNINDRNVMVNFQHKFNSSWKFTTQAAYFNYSQIGQSIWPWAISSTNDSLMQRGISIWDALGLNKLGQMFLNGEVATGKVLHKILAGVDMTHKDYYADWNQGAALGTPDFNIYKPVYGTIAAANIPKWDRSLDIRIRGVHYNNASQSFYVQDELAFFNDKLRLTVAGRYSKLSTIDPYSGNTDKSKFVPRFGLSYSFNKSASVYALYDQAFVENPGADWQGKSFDPITGDNIEMGIKKDFFGGRWNGALSVYKIIKNNVLTTDLDHTNSSGQFVYSRETGQQQTKGVEVDIKGEILPNLEVVINYAFTEAKVTKDSDPKVVGNQVAGSTKHIQNSWLSYKISEGNLKGLKFSLGYQYLIGRSSWYIFDNSQNSLPDYFRLDGGISYQTGKYAVNFNVNNILNKYLYSGAPYYGIYYWQAEPKLNSRITITYKF